MDSPRAPHAGQRLRFLIPNGPARAAGVNPGPDPKYRKHTYGFHTRSIPIPYSENSALSAAWSVFPAEMLEG